MNRMSSKHFIQILCKNVRLRTVFNQVRSASSYFVTTPIFYVNSAPHIGHMHTCVMADALHRTHLLLGVKETLFTTGTDEHGLKVQQAAESNNLEVSLFCDSVSSQFKELCGQANISHADFVRTTEPRHKKAVEHFWQELVKRGHIYKGKYAGWYSVADEAFLTASQIVDLVDSQGTRKMSIESGHPVEWIEEKNYVFPLSKFVGDVKHWLNSSKSVIRPGRFAEQVKMWLKEDLPDISVSRPRSRIHWGIPVPQDEAQVIYVWLDALVNYLTVAGYPQPGFHWPVDCHVIGKDILKFHAIYWPAFLIAAGLEPPRNILCHSHWTVDDLKMSKSLGNVIDPFEKMKKYTPDGLRYFLLRGAVPHSDGNYSETKLTRMLNAELADSIGNLLNRCTSLSLNKEQIFPPFYKGILKEHNSEQEALIKSVLQLPDIVKAHYLEGNFHHGIDAIVACVHQANRFMENCKPWVMAKSADRLQELNTVIHSAMETLRVTGILLQPIIPTLADKLLTKLGIPVTCRSWIESEHECFPSYHGHSHEMVGVQINREKLTLYTKVSG